MMTQSYFQREGYRNVRVTHAKIPKRNVFSKSFNIDHHLKCEPNNLAWKGFLEKNYASFSNNLDKVFNDKENKQCHHYCLMELEIPIHVRYR